MKRKLSQLALETIVNLISNSEEEDSGNPQLMDLEGEDYVSLTRHFAKCLGWEGTEEDQRPVLGQCDIAHLMERVINVLTIDCI